jgi:hypothetical protein
MTGPEIIPSAAPGQPQPTPPLTSAERLRPTSIMPVAPLSTSDPALADATVSNAAVGPIHTPPFGTESPAGTRQFNTTGTGLQVNAEADEASPAPLEVTGGDIPSDIAGTATSQVSAMDTETTIPSSQAHYMPPSGIPNDW